MNQTLINDPKEDFKFRVARRIYNKKDRENGSGKNTNVVEANILS